MFQDWLAKQIIRKLRGVKVAEETKTGEKFATNDTEQQSAVVEIDFQEFVTFLVDKQEQFKNLKKEYRETFGDGDEHWEPFYE